MLFVAKKTMKLLTASITAFSSSISSTWLLTVDLKELTCWKMLRDQQLDQSQKGCNQG